MYFYNEDEKISIRFKKKKEESTVNKGTTYKYNSTDVVTREEKKKLERPNFTYAPKDEIRIMSNQEDVKRKLR